MIPIARKNLLSEKGKFITSIGGVTLSILVILVPFGVYFGSMRASKAFPLNAGANLWIVQNGSADQFHTVSILPGGYENKLREKEGVSRVGAVINHATRADIDGKKVTIGVLGFDKQSGLGVPWNMYSGTNNLQAGELILDRSLAYKYGVALGDKITIGSEPFTVAGMSLETNVLVFQYAFMLNDDAQRVFQQEGAVNYYLVRAEGGVRDSLSGIVPDSLVRTNEEVADYNARVIEDSFLSIILFIAAIGMLVGISVIGITMYSMVSEKAREYGVLKAVGITSGQLFKIVLGQTLITSVVGFVVGVALYVAIENFAFYLVPAVNLSLPLLAYLFVFAAAVSMSILSTLIPMHKINTIDPAITFKS